MPLLLLPLPLLLLGTVVAGTAAGAGAGVISLLVAVCDTRKRSDGRDARICYFLSTCQQDLPYNHCQHEAVATPASRPASCEGSLPSVVATEQSISGHGVPSALPQEVHNI
jgi:hypothetical protein